MTAPSGSLADLLVLFDWNGTLMADARRALEATNDVLVANGLPALADAEFPDRFRLPLAEFVSALGIAPEHRESAQRRWNAGLARRTAPLRAQAPSVLGELVASGAVAGVVSAAGEDSVLADIHRSGEDGARLRRCLSIVVADAQDKVGHLREHRSRRPRAVYVGDTAYDIVCARRSGYLAVAVDGGYERRDRIRAAGPDALIGSLAELPELLTRRQAWEQRSEPGSVVGPDVSGCQ